MASNIVTILWAMTAAAALLIAVQYAAVWAFNRGERAALVLALIAVSVAGLAGIELALMHSQSVAEFSAWSRAIHVPLFGVICGVAVFIRLRLRAGRPWLLVLVIASRTVVLLIDYFSPGANFNFSRIDSIEQIRFLGQQVTIIGQAVTSPNQWLAAFSVVVLTIFVADAAVTCWRRGHRDERRKSLVIGGSFVLFLCLAATTSQAVVWGGARLPIIMALPFLFPVGAMAFELSWDMLRAASLVRELGESRRRLELAAGAANIGLWEWEATQDHIWATDRARELLGFSSDESLNLQRWISAVEPQEAAEVRQAITQAIEHTREFTIEHRLQPREDAVRWVALRGRCDDDEAGRPLVVRGVIREITEQKEAQGKLDELRGELAHAGRVTMLGQLASAMAHELSHPLGAILRNTEAAEMLLERAEPDLDELRSIMTDIRLDDRRAGDVIDRLRALLKRRRMDFQPVAVESLVQDVLVMVRADALSRRVLLENNVEAGLPMVAGDRVHLAQVMINLIVNGMDAMTKVSGERRVTIDARALPEGRVRIAVSDRGPGVAPEVGKRVFDPFFTTKDAGMGMGLSISRTIVEAHGGRIWIEGEPGDGATFAFTVPARPAGAA